MNNGKIVILEGTSCVGKTSLCEKLKEQGWIILPEAVRYLEKSTGKIGDEASPIPNSQEEEEYYQDQLFAIEKQKIIEANILRNQGENVVIDKSAISIIATAKAFEEQKKFKGTFKRAYNKYSEMLQELKNNDLIECDVFFLFTSNYDTIYRRNKTRNHVLEGIWVERKTIDSQRQILEILTNEVVGSVSKNVIKKIILDTTNLDKKGVLRKFNEFINDRERD